MKNIQIVSVVISLLLIPLVNPVQSVQSISEPPPVAPSLVRQGDFATILVYELNLGRPFSEEHAQQMLADIGIAPKNGWISDYPMTPDIIGELQDAVIRVASYGYLSMEQTEAVNIFQSLVADFELPIIPDRNGTKHIETPPSETHIHYIEPTVIHNYYYHSGPPVITYYPPPHSYYSLYSWVHYPFWWEGFWFSGFFVMRDFHRTSHVVILSSYGYPKHFRSHTRVIGVVSNRKKRYIHTPRGVVRHPAKRKFQEYGHPGTERSSRRLSRPHESRITDKSAFVRDSRRQKSSFDTNIVSPETRRSNVRSSFDRRSERFRDNTSRELNVRSPGISGQIKQRSGRDTSRTSVRENSTEIKRPYNRGSVIVPRTSGVRQNRIGNDQVNQSAVGQESRRNFERSSGENRAFQRPDRNAFQRNDPSAFRRPARSDQGSSRIGNNRGVHGFSQGGFSR
jgi:hypothetical protein